MSKKKQPSDDTGLLKALRFIRAAQNDVGEPYTRHCIMWDGWVYGTNRVLSAGHPVAESLQLAPHTGQFIAALERCDGVASLTALPAGLSVRAGRFRATVPCHDLAAMPPITPDAPVARLADQMDPEAADKALRRALEVVMPLATDGAQRAILAVVHLGRGSATATNAHMLFEAWHGLDLPDVLIPKGSVKALLAEKKRIAAVGVSSGSITFHFEDNSWLKSQLYEDNYPDTTRLFKACNPWPFPQGFFDALNQLKPFAEKEEVYFSKGKIHTERNPDNGACVELAGIGEGHCFNIDYLQLLEGVATSVDFGAAWGRDNMHFFGDGVRGLISPKHWQKEEAKPTPRPTTGFDDMDDDIPF